MCEKEKLRFDSDEKKSTKYERKMFTINTENVTDSVCSLLNGKVTSNTVIDLLNDVLTDEAHLAMLLAQNNVIHEKGKLPGLIVNAYLLLVDLFDLDVMKPLEYEQPEEVVAAEDEVNDDGIKIEVIDTILVVYCWGVNQANFKAELLISRP